MKSYRGLSAKYLKSQRKRTILTIAGIILSVSLLCAAGIMGESFRNKLVEDVRQEYGNYHVEYSGITEAQEAKLEKNIKAQSVGYMIQAGRYDLTGNQSLMIAACNKTLLDMHYLELSSGRLPEKENEIVLEQWIIDNMKTKPSLGGTVRLPVKDTGLARVPAGKTSGPERAKDISDREFKLVGIFKNNSYTQFMGMSVAVVNEQTVKSILGNDKPDIDAAVLIKDNLPLQKSINEITGSISASPGQVHQNSALLTIQAQSRNNTGNRAIIIVQAILMAVIILSTIAVIYNAFHISVLERIHQFGVLRSVGTTPRQIKLIVLSEACFLGIVGIPLGIVFGILGMKAVIGLFSIQSSAFFGSMEVIIHLRTLLLTALLGLATLLLSALGPAVTAGRVSPMEAILNTAGSKRVKLKRRKHPLLSFLFHVEGVMAMENLRRNRKRFFVTVFSMTIGIVLFIFFTFFVNLVYAGTNTMFQKDFAVDMPFSSVKPGFTQKDYDTIAGLPGVKTVYRLMQKNVSALISDAQVSGNYKQAANPDKNGGMYTLNGEKYYNLSSSFYGYRDMELKLYRTALIKGRIDIPSMNSENGVLVSQAVRIKNDTINASDLKVGDTITIVNTGSAASDPKPVRLKVMGILDSMPFTYSAGTERFGIVTTEEVFRRITGVNTFSRFDIELSGSADKTAVKSRLQDMAPSAEDKRFLDYTETSASELLAEIRVILYGLVVVISIIGALNIINTISTNLILRTREFGILRAVGMTPAQIKRMIQLEGAFYGLIAAFYGGVAGCILARVFYFYMIKVQSMTWHLPWQAAAEAGAAAILIGLAASVAPLKRISRMNVVETIRAEE